MVELLLTTIIGPLLVGIVLMVIEKWLDKD